MPHLTQSTSAGVMIIGSLCESSAFNKSHLYKFKILRLFLSQMSPLISDHIFGFSVNILWFDRNLCCFLFSFWAKNVLITIGLLLCRLVQTNKLANVIIPPRLFPVFLKSAMILTVFNSDFLTAVASEMYCSLLAPSYAVI